MRLVFMGTPEFAVPSLRLLLEHDYQVAAVVTAPDKPKGRGRRIDFNPIKKLALEQSLPLHQPIRLSDNQFISALSTLEPDLMVVVAFRILPPRVFSIPKFGSFNLHASLLPKYRGAAPINWAVINGEKETGVTTFFLTEKVDTGSIILQARVRIGDEETAGELHDRLAEVGASIVLQTVRLIELGKVRTRPQDETLATGAPKISRQDCRINWQWPSFQIHDYVRGLSPGPCAWTTHGSKTIKIYKTKKEDLGGEESGLRRDKPGRVTFVDRNCARVETGDGVISLLEVQQEGRKRMEIAEFLRGFPLKIEDKFE